LRVRRPFLIPRGDAAELLVAVREPSILFRWR
jgi:hypothetical protein